MLPRTFLTQLTPVRLAEAVRRVENQIWEPLPERCAIEQTASFRDHRTYPQIGDASFHPIPEPPFFWGPKYSQRWFRVTLPPAKTPATRYLRWEDQAEATVYVNGAPYYGLDIAHRHCPLPADVDRLHIEAVCIRTGIWLNGCAAALHDDGSEFRAPRLFHRNDIAWSVYHDLRVLLDVIEAEMQDWQPSTKAITDPVRFSPAFQRATPLVRRWCDRLERALDVLDRDGLEPFSQEVHRIYADSPASPDIARVVLTGHAHIDLVWLWPESVGEFKTIHTWSTATRLFERYPELRFGFSQPMAYHAVQRRAPVLHKRVQDLIREGRWDAVGASLVESDTHLPCGEALVRSLQLGQQDFKALRGTTSRVFWLPDVFGYNACMPQLLRGVGVTGFYTTKLSWSSINRFPHTSFRWRGLDGSEVVAHVSLLHDYNESVAVRNLREDILAHHQIAVHPEVLTPTGYGDGGGGPTEEMCERARRVANLAGVPRTAWGNIEPFFDRMLAVQDDLPVVAGELTVEIHRGVYTTHGRLKGAFRALERALQLREAAHVARGFGPVPDSLWRRLVFAQFHDYIPGSSIWEVYAEAIPELESLAHESDTAARAALDGAGGTRSWFNPLPVARDWLFDGKLIHLGPLHGSPESLARPAPPVSIDGDVIRSDRVEAAFSASGELQRLVVDGQPVQLVGAGHALWAYPDRPAVSPAWDVDRGTLANGRRVQMLSKVERRCADGHASVTFAFRVSEQSHGHVTFELRAGEPALRVRYRVEWRDTDLLLKAVITTAYRGSQARFGCPYGSILRSQQPGYPREEAQWEVPASRWMIVSDDTQGQGLAVVTEAKFGFTVRDGSVGVSLVRSALVTEADLHPQIRTTPDRPRHSDLGEHVIEMAIGLHASGRGAADHPAALADTLFTPCIHYVGASISAGLAGIETSPTVVAAWAKPLAAHSWVLRLHETSGQAGFARLRLDPAWSAVRSTLADPGEPEAAAPADQTEFAIPPYAVTSIQIRRRP